jgi:UDP-N-acetylmuramate dehydrogenase
VVGEEVYEGLRQRFADMPEAHRTAEGYKLSAGWLIDRAGWKGRTMGKAGVWPRNALVLYNAGGCTGTEVVALAREIQQDVKQKFGVALTPEAIII